MIFIYLSIDEDAEKWKKAVAKFHPGYQHSYLVANARGSRMLEELVPSIPRYVIYGKTGELIYKNAPAPGSEQLKTALDKYLAQSTQ